MVRRRSLFQASLASLVTTFVPSLNCHFFSEQERVFSQISKIKDPYQVQIVYMSNLLHRGKEIMGELQNAQLIGAINGKYMSAGLLEPAKEVAGDGGYRFTYRFLNVQAYLHWEQEMVLSGAVNREICHTINTIEGKILCPTTGLLLNKQIQIYYG